MQKLYYCLKKESQDLNIGDKVEVFVYKDSKDRLICTTRKPKIECGQIKSLEVKDINKLGAFGYGFRKRFIFTT